MNQEEFVARVRELSGFADREEAERAIAATLATLGERLVDTEVHALAGELPRPLAAALERGVYAGDFDLTELYDRVCRREGVEPSFGVEHAQIVCRVLAEQLGEDARTRLRKELPPSIADLFRRPPAASPPEPVVHDRGPHTKPSTLASGRPGSTHPLSEGSFDRAQAHSVAREKNPHGDTKLSSARGANGDHARAAAPRKRARDRGAPRRG
jgi:uncharacterized protein (DUF2267 family)